MAPKSLFLLYQKMNNFEKSYFLSTINHSNDVFMQCTVKTCLKVKLDLVKFLSCFFEIHNFRQKQFLIHWFIELTIIFITNSPT